MKQTDQPLLAGVIGWPVAHSLSPHLHRHWLEAEGITGDYVPLAVKPQDLEAALTGLMPLGFRGANITIPHKEAAMGLVDRVHPIARRIGAINIVLVDGKGRLEGQNSDAYGFLSYLEYCYRDWKNSAKQALLLGAGGAARAIAVALLDAGIERLFIVNRTAERAHQLMHALDDPRVEAAGWQDRSSLLKNVGLLVNTTSLGMQGEPALSLPLSLLPDDAIVYDIVYRPLYTDLLQKAQARGLRTVDGLGMLVHQAIPAFQAFYGRQPSNLDGALGYLRTMLEAP